MRWRVRWRVWWRAWQGKVPSLYWPEAQAEHVAEPEDTA